MEIKMNKEVLNKLKSDPKYLKFLRQNSSWYKTLNRNPNSYNEFVKAMKEKYKLRTIDKIDSFVTSVDLVTKILDASK